MTVTVDPYYQDELVTIYHGDWRYAWAALDGESTAVAVTDPPYGIGYESGMPSATIARSIVGDRDITERDTFLNMWGDRPALVFGSWRAPRPDGTRMLLVWDTKGALGMGDLTLPWKPAHQEIYVLGRGFVGARTSDVLSYPPVQSTAANGRLHPHQKPVALLEELICKCAADATVVDPFMGVGSTLVAARRLGRPAVGVEINERYCAIAAERLGGPIRVEDGAFNFSEEV